jgi:hypothetical protein
MEWGIGAAGNCLLTASNQVQFKFQQRVQLTLPFLFQTP